MKEAMWQCPQVPGRPRIQARSAYGRASSLENGAPCPSTRVEVHPHPAPLQVLIKDGHQAGSQHIHVRDHKHIELRPLDSCDPPKMVADPHVPVAEPVFVIGGSQRQQRDVMRRITAAGSLQELQHVVAMYDTVLQPIHWSGALVKAAKLAAVAKSSVTGAHSQPTSQHQSELQVADHLAHELGHRFLASSHHGTLGARQVANTMWALGQLHYQVPPNSNQGDLPVQLMAAAQHSIHQANPVEVAALAHGLAKLKQVQLDVWEAVSAAARACLPACGPAEIASIAWAAATTGSSVGSPAAQQPGHSHSGIQDDRLQHQQLSRLMQSLMRAVVARAHELGEGLQGRELVQVLWAAAKLGLHGSTSARIFASALPQLQHTLLSGGMSTQDIANSVWAYAKAQHHSQGRSLLTTVTQVLGGPGGCQIKHLRPSKFKAQELSNVMWAVATMSSTDVKLVSVMAAELSARSSSLGPQTIANAAWAAAKMGYHNPSFLSTMVDAAARQASQFKAQELSNLLWAVTSLPPGCDLPVSQPTGPGGLDALEACAARAAPSMPPAALAQVSVYIGFRHKRNLSLDPEAPAGSFSEPGHQHGHRQQQDPGGSCPPSELAHTLRLRRLTEATARSALTQVHKFKAQDLIALVRGLSHVPHAIDHSVMRAIADAAVQLVLAGAFRPDSLPALLAGFVRLGCTHRTLAQAVGRMAQGSINSLSTEALTQLLWAMTAMHVTDKQLLRKAAAALQQGQLSGVGTWMPPSLPASGHTTQPDCDSTSPAVQLPYMDDRPRSSSASLLRHLGWEEDGEEDEQQQDLVRTAVHLAEELQRPGGDQGHSSSNSSSSSSRRQPIHEQGHACTSSEHSAEEPGSRRTTWAILAWAFARCGFHQHQLYEKLAAAVLQQPGTQPCSRASCCRPDSSDVGAAPSAALSHLPTICLVQLLWAFAMMDHPHPGLLAAAAPTLSQRVQSGGLTPREVATVAWAYARLQHYDERLFSSVLHEAVTHSERYNLRNWSRLAWSFSTLCLPAEEAFHVRLTRLQEEANRRQRDPVPEGPYSPITLSHSSRHSSAGQGHRQVKRRVQAPVRPKRPRAGQTSGQQQVSPHSCADDDVPQRPRVRLPQSSPPSLGPGREKGHSL